MRKRGVERAGFGGRTSVGMPWRCLAMNSAIARRIFSSRVFFAFLPRGIVETHSGLHFLLIVCQGDNRIFPRFNNSILAIGLMSKDGHGVDGACWGCLARHSKHPRAVFILEALKAAIPNFRVSPNCVDLTLLDAQLWAAWTSSVCQWHSGSGGS